MINEITYPAIALLISCLVTTLSMPTLLRFCKRRGYFDIPNERKIHHNKIPRLGGVLFVPATLIGIMGVIVIIMLTGNTGPTFNSSHFLTISGIFLIYLIGLIDDLLSLPASLKFLVQFIAALFLPLCGICLSNLHGFCGIYELPLMVSYPLTIFIVLLVVNAINLIDGIDGLASGLCLIALSIFAILFGLLHYTYYVTFIAALIGCVTVFFFYNMMGSEEKFTKTFMGDAGSLTLGYALAYLTVKYAINGQTAVPDHVNTFCLAYTLLILPTFDLIRVAINRLRRGVSIFHADKTHIHHRFLAAGFSMRQSLCSLLGVQIAYICINFALLFAGTYHIIVITIDIMLFACLQGWLSRRIHRTTNTIKP